MTPFSASIRIDHIGEEEIENMYVCALSWFQIVIIIAIHMTINTNSYLDSSLTLYYDYMCSEMDFTPEKSFSSNHKFLNSSLLPLQSGQIAV